MTEREMEDLLWNYPDMFFNEPLEKFERQPMAQGIGRADLVFKDKLGRLLVVEVKKGKLPRGAIPQLVDYFGMMKARFPSKPVELLVVANSIPKERRLACEQYDIDCLEISAKRFRDVGAKVGYMFDSERGGQPPATQDDTEAPFVKEKTRQRRATAGGTLPKEGTIGHLILHYLAAHPDATNDQIQPIVLSKFPDSKWGPAHLAWYKYQIKKGRYRLPDVEE